MSLYRDLAKDDPLAVGFVAFPSGLEDEYFQELTAERRMPVKRNGFTVYRWIKDDRQDNEALDTMVQATGAAIKYGVYGLSDLGWNRLEAEREMKSPNAQMDLEDMMGANAPQSKSVAPATTVQTPAKKTSIAKKMAW
jgi:phage terminase large subunit GpA-like protein